MCCDDAYCVTPRISALAGCDRLVSKLLVIEKYSISEDPKEDTIEEEPLKEPKEKGNGYLRKGQKPSQKGQNRAWNGKA
ncbi:hypothetical protein Tco_1276665 [Tanacetum coccineum]